VEGLTLGGVSLDGAGFTLAGGLLTFDPLGMVSVLGGGHALDMPLALTAGAVLEVAPGQSLDVGGGISGEGGLTVFGGVVRLGGVNTFSGALAHKTGTVEVASVDALGAGAPSFGVGTFRYTGASAEMPGYAVDPVTPGYALIFDVVDPGTTLTVTGAVVDGVNAPLIKTGEGTLVFGYDGNQTLNGAHAVGGESALFEYSEDGVLAPTNYPAFGIERGTVVIGGTGRTTDVYASSAFIGVRTLASPTFIIDGGMNRLNNGYFTIGRGTGTTASPQQPSMYVRNGSYVDIPGSGFVMANRNGQSDFYCEPYLSVDSGSTLRVANNCFINEDGSVASLVDITNGSTFQSDTCEAARGLELPRSGGTVTMTIDAASTGRAFFASVRDGGQLRVTDKSAFEYDMTVSGFVTSTHRGLAYFDDAVLRQRSPSYQASWFMNLTNLQVGAGGLTVDVPGQRAVLSPVPVQAPDEAAGTVTKTGAGELSMPSLPLLPLHVQEGALSLYRSRAQTQVPPPSGALTFAQDAGLALSGANAAQGLALPPSVTLAAFRPHGHHSSWRFAGSALPFADGAFQLGYGSSVNNGHSANKSGAAYLARRQDVSGAWAVSFDYTGNSVYSAMADGFAFVVQNDPRGVAAVGNVASSYGYAGGGAGVEVVNSFAVAFDVYNGLIRFGEDGEFVSSAVFRPGTSIPFNLRIMVGYDGAGLVTAQVWSGGLLAVTLTREVDIPAQVGGAKAYVGFTGATGSTTGQHIIDNVQFDDGSGMLATPYCRYGGEVSLAGNESFEATLDAPPLQKGFGLDALTYAPGAAVAVRSPHGDGPPVPSLLAQDRWSLRQEANWQPDGGLALSRAEQNARGYANSLDRFAVTGSWKARMKFSRGESSGAPADCFAMKLHNRGPNDEGAYANNALSVYWRYFEGDRRDTQLRVYTNGVSYIPLSGGLTNTVPLDMAAGDPVWMDLAYDAVAHTLTVAMDQPLANGVGGVFTNVFEDVDIAAILGGVTTVAQIGFAGEVGGQWTENIVSDFTFTPEDAWGGQAGTGYLAFNEYNGSGVLRKQGNADIGLLGDVDRMAPGTAFRLEEGGLRLLRVSDEPFGGNRDRSEWVAMPNTGLWPSGELLACPSDNNTFGVITSARRVRVTEPFTARFTFLFGEGSSGNPADAFSMFFHNDPRGPFAGEGVTGNAGFATVQKSAGLRWYFYQGNGDGHKDTFTTGYNGWWDAPARRLLYAPNVITGSTVTDIEVKYDPSDLSVVMTLSHDGTVMDVLTNHFVAAIADYVDDDYAYLAFGGGTGGERGYMLIRDLALTYDAPPADTPERLMCASVEIPADAERTITLDTSVPDAPFLIGGLTLEDGAALRLRSAKPGDQLRFADTTLGSTARFIPEAGATLALDGVDGGLIIQQGQGILKLGGTCDELRLESGTVALAAPTLTRSTDLHVATGATLNLGFTGKQYIHTLTVDGIAKKGGAYNRNNAPWVTGDGTLVVTFPASGTLIMVK
ncbi:MAG: hypothetical protein FWG50_13580, partial [Kiritimatiellaeota bacterium]|nr:hypothetical protein [Kiritimatiellota bacterium]